MTFFFLVRVARTFEGKVTRDITNNAKLDGIPIKSVLVTPQLSGFIVVECERKFDLMDALRGVSRARGILPGKVTLEEAMRYVDVPEMEFQTDELLEVIAGPFKGSKVKVIEDDGGPMVAVMLMEWEHAGKIVLSKDQVRR